MNPTPEQEAEMRRMVAFLNSLVEADREWMSKLLDHHPACNDAIYFHPSVQCFGPDEPGGQRAGLLGLLNGFYGTRGKPVGYGFLGIDWDAEKKQVVRFVYTPDSAKQNGD